MPVEMAMRCQKEGVYVVAVTSLQASKSVPSRHEVGIWTTMASESFYTGTLSTVKAENGVYGLDNETYTDLYCPDIPLLGVKNVVEETTDFKSNMTLTGAVKEAKSIHWLDSGEELKFVQNGLQIQLNATGFPYGRDLIVRIARIQWKG